MVHMHRLNRQTVKLNRSMPVLCSRHMASTGRNHYVKQIHLYLANSRSAGPELRAVLKRFHAVRRTTNHWSMLSDDHATEVELMRALKVAGGIFKSNTSLETPAYVKTAQLGKSHMAQLANAINELLGTTRTRSDPSLYTTLIHHVKPRGFPTTLPRMARTSSHGRTG
jgi:hypothetical protein